MIKEGLKVGLLLFDKLKKAATSEKE